MKDDGDQAREKRPSLVYIILSLVGLVWWMDEDATRPAASATEYESRLHRRS